MFKFGTQYKNKVLSKELINQILIHTYKYYLREYSNQPYTYTVSSIEPEEEKSEEVKIKDIAEIVWESIS